MSEVTALGALGRGLICGVAATTVMTGWQELAARLQGGSDGSDADESSAPAGDPWETASAPAQAARRILEGVFDRTVPAERIGLLTNVAHWSYGTGWGALYGVVQGPAGRAPLRNGLLFGTGVWAASYLMLVPMGIYQPPWTYAPGELALDLSYHLAYGAGLGASYAALDH